MQEKYSWVNDFPLAIPDKECLAWTFKYMNYQYGNLHRSHGIKQYRRKSLSWTYTTAIIQNTNLLLQAYAGVQMELVKDR